MPTQTAYQCIVITVDHKCKDAFYSMLHTLYFFFSQGKILIGSKDNDVMEISEKSGAVTVVVGGHGEGEVWGLDRHPSLPRFITASYDGTVRLWDVSSKVCLSRY